MAAAPASRLNETHSPDFFELFGLPRRFAVDRAGLERRFYELSRETHPDRFATAGADALRESVERMSLLNEAYRTLRDPAELREYFLRLEGFESPAEKGQAVPAELAESWFELQDSLMEDPSGAADRIAAFEQELAGMRARVTGELLAIERAIDEAMAAQGRAPRERLEQLSATVRKQSYLKSMERDVERLKQQRRWA